MTGSAGDARVRSGIVHIVEIWVVEGSAEEWDDIVATGAPARGFYAAVAFEGDFAGFADAEEIGLVVEGAEMMGAVEPAVVSVLVTLHAVVVHHERFGGDEIAGGGAGEGGFKVFGAFFRSDDALPFARILGMQEDHADYDHTNCARPA